MSFSSQASSFSSKKKSDGVFLFSANEEAKCHIKNGMSDDSEKLLNVNMFPLKKGFSQ